MGFLRRIFRIITIFGWCTLAICAAAPCMFCVRGTRRSRLGARCARTWARGAAFLLGLRITRHGEIPEGQGRLIVSNHLGYLDVLAHASTFLIRFAPKAEIRKWPFFGWLTALNDPIWIDRRHPRLAAGYAAQFTETLRRGLSLLVYPEGTSSDGKHGLLPFKSTPFAAAIDAGAEILPTLLFYREEPKNSPPAAWFGDISFGTHLWRTLAIRRIAIDLYVLKPVAVPPGCDRKQLAEEIHQLMEEEYRKIEV